MNPMREREVISQILHDCGLLEISEGFEHETSIKKEESNEINITKSQEELRNFLRLVLQRPEVMKTWKFQTKG